MAPAPKPFSWEDIDHSLVALKISVINKEMQQTSSQDLARIRFENHANENHGAVTTKRLETHLQRTDELAERTYEVYCEVWTTIQRRKKSPAFLLAVCEKAILPLIAARRSILEELRLEDMRTGHSNPELTKARVVDFFARLERLAESWRTNLEIQAKECGYADSGQQEETATEQQQIEGALGNGRSQKSTQEYRAEFTSGILRELKVLRGPFKEGVPEEDYSRHEQNYPKFRSFQICRDHPDLRQKMTSLGGMDGINRFAFQLAAVHFGLSDSTIESDYYKHRKKDHTENQARNRVPKRTKGTNRL